MKNESRELCYVALGTNKGDRAEALRLAMDELGKLKNVEVKRASPVYENAAVTIDDEEQRDFLNAVVELRVTLEPLAFMERLQAIEEKAGREKKHRKWSPRELDLDVLVWGEQPITLAGLTVPHPRMGARRFVLQPLTDLRPDLYVPPPFDATAEQLLDHCPDDEPLRVSSDVLT